MKKVFLFIIAFVFCGQQVAQLKEAQNIYNLKSGSISFTSNAPLELIKAQSSKLKGLLDASKNQYAFSIPIKTFEGFNSPLQKEHFNENYMESAKYPEASFSGTIQEKIDYAKDGSFPVSAKGKLTVHGVTKDRTIKGTLAIKNGEVVIDSKFIVALVDHNITIPKIVNQKIATEIEVSLKTVLAKK